MASSAVRPRSHAGIVRCVNSRIVAPLRSTLLTLAGHAIVPVHVGPGGIIAPRPDVQLEEGGEAEAVGAADELEGLPFKCGRRTVMGEPGGSVHDILDADEAETAGGRFIDQSLGL